MGLVTFPVSPPLAASSDAPPSYPLDLPPAPCLVPVLPMIFPPLTGVCPRSLLVALVSESPSPTVDAACRGPLSGFRFATHSPCWGVVGVPWLVGTNPGFFSVFLSYDMLLSDTKYHSLSISPSASFPPEKIPESASLPSRVLVGPPGVPASGKSSGPQTSRLPLRFMLPFPVPGALVY